MNQDYKNWLIQLKQQIRSSQIKAALKVNTELIALYWQLGKEIIQKETTSQWGDKLIPQLSKDLLAEFPEMKGFSKSNLYYIKKWFIFYSQEPAIVQQVVGQIRQQAIAQTPRLFTTIPWGHHLQIITKCKNVEEALFYMTQAAEYGWSRNVLVHQKVACIKGKAQPLPTLTLLFLHRKATLQRNCLKTPTNLIFKPG